ncbi:MAG TPA: hypothetical protein ENJ90_00130 [Devosia sp.]|nr:hypothetical protein [Devosia sp.]
MLSKIECFSCRGLFDDIEGPVHRYMSSSQGCWAAFGKVLAREYSEPELLEIHRLSVDAYAVQHPGEPSPQTIGSIGVHLIRLCLFHEYDLTPEHANDAMLKVSKNKGSFVWLEPPGSLGPITVGDVVKSNSVEEHKSAVREWAKGAWEAWSPHHRQIRTWLSASGQD